MKKIIFATLFCLAAIAALSRQPRKFTFIHYTSTNGLVSNQVNSIVQDDEGYLWIGTTDGLQRFDGKRYETFRHRDNDPSTLPVNAITQLLIDKKKNLWILFTNGEAGVFNTKNFSFHKSMVTVKNELSLSAPEKKLITDEDGNIFLLFEANELLTWNEKLNEFSGKYNFFATAPHWRITSFARQPGTKKFWIGLFKGGVAIYNDGTKQLSYPGSNAAGEIAVDHFAGMDAPGNFFFDAGGRLWLDTRTEMKFNVHCYDPAADNFILKEVNFSAALRTHYQTSGFMQQKDGTIWIIGQRVFARYLEKEKQFEHVYNGYDDDRGISYRVITHLMEDKEKNIWIGTGNNGIFRFNPAEEFFTNVTHLNRVTGQEGDGSPLVFAGTKDGSVLSGVWGDGLYRYDKNFNPVPLNIKGIPENNPPPVWDMCVSRDSNTIWMGAQPGLYAYDQKNKSAIFYNPRVFSNRTVREIQEDKNGNLWIGIHPAGLYKWNAKKGKIKFEEGLSEYTGIPSLRVYDITIDKKGFTWIATATDGAYVIDPTTDSVILHFGVTATGAYKLPEKRVSAIFEYDDSLMVIATASRLILYNRFLRQSRFLGSSETIPGIIASMEKDRSGNLWVSASTGLYNVDWRSKTVIYFDREDGMSNDFFILSSSYVLSDGRMIFGAAGLFIVFDPAAIIINTATPNLVITGIKIMNERVNTDSLLRLPRVKLGAMDNSLQVEFSPLVYSSTYAVSYKLKGLDKDWIQADESSQANYSHLPPGTYTLQFRMMDEKGRMITADTELTVVVRAVFWKTWWFYSLLALGLAALLFWFDRERAKRKEALQQVRSKIAGNMHEQLSSALGNINVLSEMAWMKADKEPEKSKGFIEQIRNKSGTMISLMEDMFWSISPDNDNIEKTIARMQEYIQGLNNTYNVDIEMLIEEKVKQLNLDMQVRHESLLLFKEMIQGIIKAGADHCKIHLEAEKNSLAYHIQVSKNNCNMQQLTNLLHSQDISQRLTSIKGSIDSAAGKGDTMVVLRIPVI